jgi:hypothetical protein
VYYSKHAITLADSAKTKRSVFIVVVANQGQGKGSQLHPRKTRQNSALAENMI